MNLPYIINVALILLACLAFYKLLLRRETFYKVNRYMLIVCLVISFALPLLQVPEQFSLRKSAVDSRELSIVSRESISETGTTRQSTTTSKQQESSIKHPEANNQTSNLKPQTTFSFAQLMTWLFWVYWFGVIVFAASFMFQLVLLL